MSDKEKMICPTCGVEMNCHTEKLVYSGGRVEQQVFDPINGGVIEEFYTCPECGQTLARRAA